MNKSNLLSNIYKETCIFLCAFALFCVFLLIGTWFTESNKEEITSDTKPFSMYDWHYGKGYKIVNIADICGVSAENDNAFIHVRKEKNNASEVIIWLYENNLERNRYKLNFIFGDTSFVRSGSYFVNNEGKKVLYVNRPLLVLRQMRRCKAFSIDIKMRDSLIGRYDYKAFDVLKWGDF